MQTFEWADTDLDTMALTVWGEARGESAKGQIAVAWVIKNRWMHPRWWSRHSFDSIPDDTISAVCRDPWQFSCWNPSDPNRKKLEDSTTKDLDSFIQIRKMCELVLLNEISDPTNTADHYVVTKIANSVRWARGRKPCAVIGNHSFFRIEL